MTLTKNRAAATLATVLALAGACSSTPGDEAATPAPNDGTPSLSVEAPSSPVKGNVATLPVDVRGIEIVAADGDTSGRSGHFHVFVNTEPTAAGETIGRGPGIIHTTQNPIVVTGLTVGRHTITVVLGDGTHTRILPELQQQVLVDVEGPAVRATAPSTMTAGGPEVLEVDVQDLEIVAADGDTSGRTGHLHYLIDLDSPPMPGDVIGPAEKGRIVHSTDTALPLGDLAAGEHTIWVVAGDGTHTVIDPLIADKVVVTVREAAA